MPCGTFSVYSSAAAPASMPPMRNVVMMMRSRETPISVAVVGSWATARMPRPNLVRLIAMSVQHRQDERRGDDDQRDVGDRRAEDVELRLGLHQGDGLLGIAAAVALDDLRQHEVDELLQHERHADGGDQERQRACVAAPQRPVGHDSKPIAAEPDTNIANNIAMPR